MGRPLEKWWGGVARRGGQAAGRKTRTRYIDLKNKFLNGESTPKVLVDLKKCSCKTGGVGKNRAHKNIPRPSPPITFLMVRPQAWCTVKDRSPAAQ